MVNTPSTPGDNGRGPAGRFGAGNGFGRGNPHAQRVARLRSALLKSVTPDDLRDVVATLVAQAKEGDVAAARELFQRLLGPPVELDMIERIGSLERRVAELQQEAEPC